MYGAGQLIGDLGARKGPLPFEMGQATQQHMEAELIEIQKADLGRKYARVDRRPLDPPPVVLLKLYETIDNGRNGVYRQEIENYDEIPVLGLVCTVDLFPVPMNERPSDRSRHGSVSSGSASGSSTPYSDNDGGRGSQGFPANLLSAASFSSGYVNPDEIVHYVDNHPIAEGTKVTGALVGATVIQPNLVEYQGKKALVFVFADLAVKIEGHFILRYRSFDIYSRTKKSSGGDQVGMQAECYGGPFRVYSTKEFPGLHASTELTKHLARWGVRLNIRETERRRRKKGEKEESAPLYSSGAMKRKWVPVDGRGSRAAAIDGGDVSD